jgi:hypothetical protein
MGSVTNNTTRVWIANWNFSRSQRLQQRNRLQLLQWHLLGCVLWARSVCCWSLVCREKSGGFWQTNPGSLNLGRPTRNHVTPDIIIDYVRLIRTDCIPDTIVNLFTCLLNAERQSKFISPPTASRPVCPGISLPSSDQRQVFISLPWKVFIDIYVFF